MMEDNFGALFFFNSTETSKAELNGKSSEKVIQNDYKNGFAYKITDTQNPKILWETKEVNARGQLTKATLGNGIGIVNTYDSSNFGNVSNKLIFVFKAISN